MQENDGKCLITGANELGYSKSKAEAITIIKQNIDDIVVIRPKVM